MIHNISKGWRAKVERDWADKGAIVIRIQRRFAWLFWESVYPCHYVRVSVGTGFLHKDNEPWNYASGSCGERFEAWKPGQFNLKARIKELYEEALAYQWNKATNMKELLNQ
jgi:hypothetical protein